MIVVASIHQPSTSTLLLFDNVLLLSQGQTVYYGPPTQILSYFSSLGHSPPQMMSPAEFMLELTNVDFMRNDNAVGQLENLVKEWSSSEESKILERNLDSVPNSEEHLAASQSITRRYPRGVFMQSVILLHRMALVQPIYHPCSQKKSYRDPLAYFVRVSMYLGLAILMGTAWLRLSYSQENIQNFMNALFFGSAFMSFMVMALFYCFNEQAVAYIPAFLEDRAAMIKERANGLCGSTSFLIANTIIGIPFLCTQFPDIQLTISPNLRPFQHRHLLVKQLSSRSVCILQLCGDFISRSDRSRIARCSHLISFSNFCCGSRTHRFCKWIVDDCWWISGYSKYSQRVLEIYILPIRLPTLRILCSVSQSDGRKCIYL